MKRRLKRKKIEIGFYGFRIHRLELEMTGFVFFSVLFVGVERGRVNCGGVSGERC